MSGWRAAVGSALLLVAIEAACDLPAGRRSPSTVIVSIVGTNDLHGGVLASDGRGGLALLDGFVRNLRAARDADGGGLLLVDAGDLFQGTLESNLNEGSVVVSAYNAIGYSVSAVGNHEFDFGPVGESATPRTADDDPRGALKARAAEARFPFLAANILDEATGTPVDWPNVKPSVLVDVAGVRIGIVGLTTTETLSTTMAANTRGLTIAPLASTLEAEAATLRRNGAAIVVAAAHAGGRCTEFSSPSNLSSCAFNEEIFEVARALPPRLVDVIVAGHRHEGIAHEVSGVAIVSSYFRGRAFGRVDVTVDRGTGRVQSRRIYPPHEVCAREDPSTGACTSPSDKTGVPAKYEGRPVQASQEIETILAPAVARARELKGKLLRGTIEESLPRVTSEESALGNLVADWMRALAPNADLAIGNGGGLRAELPSGPLTYGRLYEVLPFDNQLALLTLTGAELRNAIAGNLQRGSSVMNLSGVRAVAVCEGGTLRVSLTRPAGVPLSDSEVLTVVTNEFLATGGDDFFKPVMPLRIAPWMDGTLVRDRIAEWLSRTGGTWRGADLVDPAHRRLLYPGTRPVRCGANSS